MATAFQANAKFYVYEHWRPDRGECFYVGKGQGVRANNMKTRNGHHRAIQAKLARCGMCVEIRLVANGLTEMAAFAREVERIALWRADGADLTNQTNGGDGASGAVRSEATRARLSAVQRERWAAGREHSPETCARISASNKGHTRSRGKIVTPEQRAKLSAAGMGKVRPPETREKMSAAQRKRWAEGRVVSLETRAKMSASHRARLGQKAEAVE